MEDKKYIRVIIAVLSILYSLRFFAISFKYLYRDFFHPEILVMLPYNRPYIASSWIYFLVLIVAAIFLIKKPSSSIYIKLYQFVFIGLIVEFVLDVFIWRMLALSIGYIDIPIYLFGLIYFSTKKKRLVLKKEGIHLIKHYLIIITINVLLVVVSQLFPLPLYLLHKIIPAPIPNL